MIRLAEGDFDVIVDEQEKYGGLSVSIKEVEHFRHSIQTCNLSHLGFKGSIFTWWHGRLDEAFIFKRLDVWEILNSTIFFKHGRDSLDKMWFGSFTFLG